MGFFRHPIVAACFVAAALAGASAASLAAAAAQEPKPAAAATTGPSKVGKLPHLTFDLKAKQIRVECETLGVDTPLEFFAVVYNGPEHEAIVRSKVKPSDLHTALLAVGLRPGSPVTFSKSLEKWIPPHGPPLQIHMEYEKDGKRVTEPASRWMRNLRTKKPMPTTTWIFAGSRVMNDGNYAADATGYLVSVVNFDMTVIDIPDLASASNESLEWERNPDAVPPAGTKVTMIIEPAGKREGGAGGGGGAKEGEAKPVERTAAEAVPTAGGPLAAPAPAAATAAAPRAQEAPADNAADVSDVKLDEELVERAVKKWDQIVGPKAKALREAAQAHYDAINALRREQQRLIDEADRIQRAIDRLERQYQDMTTPQPDLGEPSGDAAAPREDAAPADAR